MIVWFPRARALVVRVAVVVPPAVLTLCADPRLLPPSWNCTEPAGLPETDPVIVAVNVTD